MSYTSAQEKSHIQELQKMLYGISLYNAAIPHIVPDGIFGSGSQAAVRDFQQFYGLRVTGEVNQTTWEKIVQVYHQMIDTPPQPLYAFPKEPGTTILAGEQGFPVLIIQAILFGLSERYANLIPCPMTGDFDNDTLRSLQMFQKLCVFPVTGCVDCTTWNMLAQAGSDLLIP